MGTKKFNLGRASATFQALHLLTSNGCDFKEFLSRHMNGDWGDVSSEDARANEEALIHDLRIISAYKIGDEKIWIITEADRSATTILLPSEY